jgi:hypothetical protein
MVACRMLRAAVAMLVVTALAAACDRDLVPAPRAAHDARDDADARRAQAQLAALPGVERASVVVHRPFRDPLAPAPPAALVESATASVLLVGGDASTEAAARRLLVAALPDVRPEGLSLVVAPRATPPITTASVGPFLVAKSSSAALRVTLALGFATIAILAGLVAYRRRPR